MATQSNILLGTVTKTQGFDGKVIVRSGTDYPVSIKKIESVFLIIEGKPVPFFISYFELKGSSSIILKIEGYDSPEAVNEFIGKEVKLAAGEWTENVKSTFLNITGFRIFSENEEFIGAVKELTEAGGQIIMSVSSVNGREILIPLHNDLILDMDEKKKIIRMIIPDGLTGLNA